MNNKKILIITLGMIIIFSTLTIASAGLFGSDDNANNNITLNIIDSSIDYNCYHANFQGEGPDNWLATSYIGYVTINITGLDENQLKENLSDTENWDGELNFDEANLTLNDLDINNCTVENGTLTIYLNGVAFNNGLEEGQSGTTKLTSGWIEIYPTYDSSHNTPELTLNFKND